MRWGTGEVQYPWMSLVPHLTENWASYSGISIPTYRRTPEGVQFRGMVRPTKTLSLGTNASHQFATGLP